MKIVATSDMHCDYESCFNFLKGIEADTLVIAGDLEIHNIPYSKINFRNFIYKCQEQFKHIIVTPGNHDWGIRFQENRFRAFLYETISKDVLHIVVDDFVEIDGVKFFCSPYTPIFWNWAYMLERKSLKRKWKQLKKSDKIDVLLTHGPAFGIGDRVYNNPIECVGDIELLNCIYRIQPKVHVFGHIHEGYGEYKSRDLRTRFLNVSLMNERYEAVNPPIVFEI